MRNTFRNITNITNIDNTTAPIVTDYTNPRQDEYCATEQGHNPFMDIIQTS